MASIFDVAKYILHKKGNMSAMKLQKLCYYAQAWSLVWDDAELFKEDFEAWANGPVSPELFRVTKGQYLIHESDEPGDITKLNSIQIDTINTVLDYYYPHNAQWLSRLSHMEKPWKDARGSTPPGEYCDCIITKESMAMYYGSL